MGLPAFVLVGVPRAATTSLYHYMAQHPGIDVSRLKEINFLSYPGDEAARTDTPWLHFPVRTLDDYERLFTDGQQRVGVDFSASCFRSPVAVERIRRFVPDAGLLVVLRDPVARAYSAYLSQLRKGYESRPPEVALVPGTRPVDNGFYSEPLARFLDAFGRPRVGIWLFDDIVARPAPTMADVFTHLGVDPAFELDLKTVYNRASVSRDSWVSRALPSYRARDAVSRRLPAGTRPLLQKVWRKLQAPAPTLPEPVAARLRALYAPDIRRVQDLIGRDLTTWLDP
ncbi:MAG: hypothetical protein V7605_805 [Acidimicrobiaceae bacterium]